MINEYNMQTLNAETREWVSAIGLCERYPQIEWLCDISEDAVAVRVGSLWGFVDRNGCWIAEPQYTTRVEQR